MMKQRTWDPIQVTRRMAAEPLVAGARTIEPVMRVECRGRSRADGTTHGGMMRVRLIPIEVVVRDGARTQTLVVEQPPQAVRALLRNALLVSGVCLLLMVLVRWVAARSNR
jgi:hypothetical protein